MQANNVKVNLEGTAGMGYHAEVGNGSKSKEKSLLSPRVSKSLMSQDKGNVQRSERPIERLNNNHHDMMERNVRDSHLIGQASSGNYQQKRPERKATEADELVKYMSNLPCYLQRTGKGDNVQEKALNFGVLDWGRLEKWKSRQKREPKGRNVYTMPTTSTPSSFPISKSSYAHGRSDCSTSSRPQRRPSASLNCRLKLPLKEGQTRVFNGRDSNDTRASHDIQKIQPKSDQPTGKGDSGFKLKKDKKKASDSKMCQPPEVGNLLSNLKDDGAAVHAKGKSKTLDGETKKNVHNLQESDYHPRNRYPIRSPNPCDSVNSSDCHQHECLEMSQQSEGTRGHQQDRCHDNRRSFECTACSGGRWKEESRSSFSEDFYFHFADHFPTVPHSCPLICDHQSSKWQDLDFCNPVDIQGQKVSSDKLQHIISEGRSSEKNKSTVETAELPQVRFSGRLRPEEAQPSGAARRDLSPFKRLSAGLHKMSRSASSTEALDAQRLNSTSSNTDSLYRDKASNGTRRQSPLRRILDPILKTKALNRHFNFDESVSVSHNNHADESSCTKKPALDELSASCNSKLNSTGQAMNRNLNFSRWDAASTHSSLPDEKHTPSTTHALLQIASKNGLPLFTFTFDRDCDILAATMRKICIAGKDDFDWICTFYSVREVKKKTGRWMNPSSKSKGHGYISNIVGHMKVSCNECPKSTSTDSSDHVITREFVLFGAELKLATHETLNFLPNSELAAVVVDLPKEKRERSNILGQESRNEAKLSEPGVSKCHPQGRLTRCSAEDSQKMLKMESRSLPNFVVILPDGVHALPTTGVPSSLIDRWKSGGSCDCGGWDEGCVLTILTNEDPQKPSSYQSCSIPEDGHQLDLFVQGVAQENKHVFSLAALKEGLYTVNFNASISLLQAFAICIAVLHGRKPTYVSEVCNLLDAKTSVEQISKEDRIKVSIKTSGEAPATYIVYPPLSPVGRV